MSPAEPAARAAGFSARLAPFAVRAAALWVLVVSSIKMVEGSPGSLPTIIRNNPLGGDLTFSLTLSIELAFALGALISVRLGWWMMSALLAVFLAVLAHLIWIGATSCGCFGGAVPFTPYQMLGVDGPLFVALMLSRKGAWSSAAPARTLATGVAMLIGALAPWVYIENEPSGTPPQTPAATQPSGQQVTTPGETPPTNTDPNTSSAANTTNGGAAPSKPPRWQPPNAKPRWVNLNLDKWVGKSIHDTDLAKWVDTSALPDTANWVLYSAVCEHCRDYLNWLNSSFGADPKVYVFVRLSTPDDDANNVIQQKPPGEEVALPADIQWPTYPENPPWELVLEGGTIVEAIHHDVNISGLDSLKRWKLEGGAVVESTEQRQF